MPSINKIVSVDTVSKIIHVYPNATGTGRNFHESEDAYSLTKSGISPSPYNELFSIGKTEDYERKIVVLSESKGISKEYKFKHKKGALNDFEIEVLKTYDEMLRAMVLEKASLSKKEDIEKAQKGIDFATRKYNEILDRLNK